VKLLLVSASGESVPHRAAHLERMTERVAAGLASRGVRAGDVVLVSLPKGLHWLTTIRALWRLGAVSLPCPDQLT
jgi:non-ribosomal peptide synthetase component E (peptide arylation enzyme)